MPSPSFSLSRSLNRSKANDDAHSLDFVSDEPDPSSKISSYHRQSIHRDISSKPAEEGHKIKDEMHRIFKKKSAKEQRDEAVRRELVTSGMNCIICYLRLPNDADAGEQYCARCCLMDRCWTNCSDRLLNVSLYGGSLEELKFKSVKRSGRLSCGYCRRICIYCGGEGVCSSENQTTYPDRDTAALPAMCKSCEKVNF